MNTNAATAITDAAMATTITHVAMATAITDTAVNVSSSNNGHTYHIMIYAVVIKQTLIHVATMPMATAVLQGSPIVSVSKHVIVKINPATADILHN